MSDLIERLTFHAFPVGTDVRELFDEAADEIERLRAELAAAQLSLTVTEQQLADARACRDRLDAELAEANADAEGACYGEAAALTQLRIAEKELAALKADKDYLFQRGQELSTELAALTGQAKLSIPTATMEQEFATHYRRGYKRGVADTLKAAQSEPVAWVIECVEVDEDGVPIRWSDIDWNTAIVDE